MSQFDKPRATTDTLKNNSPRAKYIKWHPLRYAYSTRAVMNGSRGDSEHEAHPAVHNVPRLSETSTNAAYSS